MYIGLMYFRVSNTSQLDCHRPIIQFETAAIDSL